MAEANSASFVSQMLAFDDRTKFYVPTMTPVGGKYVKESILLFLYI